MKILYLFKLFLGFELFLCLCGLGCAYGKGDVNSRGAGGKGLIAPQGDRPDSPSNTSLSSHQQWAARVSAHLQNNPFARQQVDGYLKTILSAASKAIKKSEGVILPGAQYTELYTRDSFWALMALWHWGSNQQACQGIKGSKDYLCDQDIKNLVASVIQSLNAGARLGKTPTAVRTAHPESRDHMRDDESTILFVLHNFLLYKTGQSLQGTGVDHAIRYLLNRQSYLVAQFDQAKTPPAFGGNNQLYRQVSAPMLAFIQRQGPLGAYISLGEVRNDADNDFSGAYGSGQTGAFHNWLDTMRLVHRQRGPWVAIPGVFSSTQGLYVVALKAAALMASSVGLSRAEVAEVIRLQNLAQDYYKQLAQNNRGILPGLKIPDLSTSSGGVPPELQNLALIDITSFLGEALSLYLFDTSILDQNIVNTTFSQFLRVYQNNRFYGFRVVSRQGEANASRIYNTAAYLPLNLFYAESLNSDGHYHRGGIWPLYDFLALYVAARHGNTSALTDMMERISSECTPHCVSVEVRHSSQGRLGEFENQRTQYAWNAFVGNLLLPKKN